MIGIIKKSYGLVILVCNISAFAQDGQISITRVQQMPNLPAPYLMRNWKQVATQYDAFVFDKNKTGLHLPLVELKATGINYPELQPILLDTYVGTTSASQAEGINIIPSIVGASLNGIDKSNQNGINWVEKVKDFYNSKNGQHIYLNGYNASSGKDWWYDVMPNIFFYQLYTHYPSISGFDQQFTTVADRWLTSVYAMGGNATPWTVPNMNYRAWNLATMKGLALGVKEPEAAGGIGWLLYHAYLRTGETKYLEGAQLSMEFLSGLTSNPSYELQLPYGALVAAKMNAEQGTSYDVPKILNWCFNRGELRGWGAVSGKWNGVDVHGLIGEANDSGNDYAFALNGFQQAAALVPLLKYDKRFTRDIAKWVLNLANASRLFYSSYLPAASQDDFAWSATNDPNSTIGYEALKEVWEGKPLYATGDAKRSGWAETNLSLYSSSSVGYLASVVNTTNVEGILQLDINKTDFFTTNIHPSYVLYNPHTENKLVTLTLPSGSHDIYDALSESIISTNVSGTASVQVKANEAVLLVYLPAGSTRSAVNGKLYVGNQVIDHHYGYNFNPPLRIKSLAVADTLVEFNQPVPIYLTVENAIAGATYTWFDITGQLGIFSTPGYTWTVPPLAGRNVLKIKIESDGKYVMDSLVFNVVENIPAPPVINSISTDKPWSPIGSQIILTCHATDDAQTPAELVYSWTVPSGGTIINQTGSQLTWQPPAVEGVYDISCKVSDQDALTTIEKKLLLVKQPSLAITPAFAYYPLDGDVLDYSGNNRHAVMAGVALVSDARGEAGSAYQFDSGSDIISLENSAALNFQDKLTLSFWVKLNSLTEESFILSHGSWEERWKVSVTPAGYLRWTVKTNIETKDLDSSFPLTLNQFYHFTVVYSGYSLELYADGELDTFSSHSGLMSTTSKSLTFGRKDVNQTNYFLRGTLDEVRIYNATLSPDEIVTLPTRWGVVTATEEQRLDFNLYPNPAQESVYILGVHTSDKIELTIYDTNGRLVFFKKEQFANQLKVTLKNPVAGLLIFKIQTATNLYYKKVFVQ